jgi:hypothetical protein
LDANLTLEALASGKWEDDAARINVSDDLCPAHKFPLRLNHPQRPRTTAKTFIHSLSDLPIALMADH